MPCLPPLLRLARMHFCCTKNWRLLWPAPATARLSTHQARLHSAGMPGLRPLATARLCTHPTWGHLVGTPGLWPPAGASTYTPTNPNTHPRAPPPANCFSSSMREGFFSTQVVCTKMGRGARLPS